MNGAPLTGLAMSTQMFLDQSNFIHIQDLGCQINERIRTVWRDQIPEDRVKSLEVEY